MISWFKKVTFTCNNCKATQRIPLRRIHSFERFHELRQGQPVLIMCPICDQGLQIPSFYQTHTGVSIKIDPENVPQNSFIHSNF